MCGVHFSDSIKRSEVLVKEGQDKSNSRVDVSLQAVKAGYTINLYNTTSRLMVNGKNYKRFKKEFQSIKEKVKQAPLRDMNDTLRQQLLSAQASLSSGSFTPLPEIEDTQIPDKSIESNTRRQSQRQAKKAIIWDPSEEGRPKPGLRTEEECICGKPVQTDENALMCNHCSMWIHMCCDPAVTPKVYTQHENEPSKRYLCPMCEYDRLCEIISDDEETVIPAANAPQETEVLDKDASETSAKAISGVTDDPPGDSEDAPVKDQEPSTSAQAGPSEDISTKGKSVKGQLQKGSSKAAPTTNQNRQISIKTPSTLAPPTSTTPPDPIDLPTAQPTQSEGSSSVMPPLHLSTSYDVL